MIAPVCTRDIWFCQQRTAEEYMTVVFARLAVDVFAPHLAVNKTNRPRFWFRTSRPQCQTDPLAQKKGHSLESHPSATHQPSAEKVALHQPPISPDGFLPGTSKLDLFHLRRSLASMAFLTGVDLEGRVQVRPVQAETDGTNTPLL